MRRRFAVPLVSAVAAVGLFGVLSGSAYAADWEVNTGVVTLYDPDELGYFNQHGDACAIGSPNGRICFDSQDDGIYVMDEKKDGHSVTGYWLTGNRKGKCISKAGAGKWAYCSKNFTEHKAIDIWMEYNGHKYLVTGAT
ncbi:hypothetical protein [Streptomyces sp. HUAS TT20]|uniref:hypothetical protein n=1 Tax=Streptomyces sp. HUAS TT20 TaxID=3447509 RepID=UPI0021D91357|nr:hypothetical protein [Streptomyces sp. HUAS 15-9]UXY29722.1 hypothetical protein N8I87_26285 [Streptomyces sp. HUAS 15-9]